jgi:glycosyltransferase involved in cell wall biosynthesis
LKATKRRRILYLCNAFDDAVKAQRRITTDSPAASRKVSFLCRSTRAAGGEVSIVSMGRGRAKGTWVRYPARTTRLAGVPAVYLDFWDVPGLTHAVSFISLFFAVLRLARSRETILVFYNYYPHYLAAALLAKVLGLRCILDVEDGYIANLGTRAGVSGLTLRIYSALCSAGTMLASVGLGDPKSKLPSYVCYGIAEPVQVERTWAEPIHVHLGGSLFKDTGVGLFLDALSLLREHHPETWAKLRFDVTGFGDYAPVVERAALGELGPHLKFWGSVTGARYQELIRGAHAGLCLKLPSSELGRTTFPSKVVEIASYGLLLISTPVSDVPLLFDSSSAVLLHDETPAALAAVLRQIASDPESAQRKAAAGQTRIASLLSPARVGAELLRFWEGSAPATPGPPSSGQPRY